MRYAYDLGVAPNEGDRHGLILSRSDMEFLARKLAEEENERRIRSGGKRRSVEPIAALAKAVGCSWNTAQSWLEGNSMPRRKCYTERLQLLAVKHFPHIQIQLAKAEVYLLQFGATQLRETMGEYGRIVADMIDKEILYIRGMDIGRVAHIMAKEINRAKGARRGRKIEEAAALAKAVGCSWNTAKAWIEGSAVPRRKYYINKLNELIESRKIAPRAEFVLTRVVAKMLLVVASDLREFMGTAGAALGARIEDAVHQVYPEMTV